MTTAGAESWGLFVGGGWTPAENDAAFDVLDPATTQAVHAVADASPGDGVAAVDVAARAFDSYRNTSPAVRAEILSATADTLARHEDELAALITVEMGKPLRESVAEVRYAADFARWFAGEAVRLPSEHRRLPAGDAVAEITHEPVGPSLLITPWNFPISLPLRKIAAALAAGCSMVLKPAEETPVSALRLVELMSSETPLPPGVVNVVPTTRPADVVAAMLEDGRLRKLSFTGSTPIGRHLAGVAAGKLMRVSLELGGDAPFIVCEDADIDAAMAGVKVAKLRNGGSACTAANRILVHRSVAEPFVESLVAMMDQVTVGNGFDPSSELGPMVSLSEHQRLADLISTVESAGGRRLTSRNSAPTPGYFFPPAVLGGPEGISELDGVEIFGPVVPVQVFDHEHEVVARANDTPYGLVAYVYTASLERARRIARELEFGMVGVNRGTVSDAAAPFGGVKASGIGREGGHEGVLEYTSIKYVASPHA